MTANSSHDLVRGRLRDALDSELGVAAALAGAARSIDQVEPAVEIERLRAAVRDHIVVLAALGLDPGDPSSDTLVATEIGGPPTRAILSVQERFVAATQAYASLFATARVLCEPEVCDLAERHLAHHVEGLRVLARILPGALARELNADGLFCRCVCPSCGIGACLCVRSSIAVVAEAWGWPGLPIGDGIELLSPPRPGSQLAAASIHEGDWIVSVDGTQVSSNPELQAALRHHQIGEVAQIRIRSSTGEQRAVAISHVSDWPQ
jgi:membrane-associated protease RseP (regulator of RpoE activity)